jgi:hypothetical protein
MNGKYNWTECEIKGNYLTQQGEYVHAGNL